ncbi:helix-turn-helix domain-containing protein [Brachybacterium sacelli]|uniref:Transcriptional regulator with XRE-family HTH domain n=1 Tax=Brachybacterium sacelli TaxID=173364 RepID=A0ABS4X6Y4_9MICO|nr:helix-turn-helix transcriptional regulator [Brachybacterium sacelli]MBP2384216.1 transcriptional regulator with XRE-family HTH domain [Brachybacterium sacelli]
MDGHLEPLLRELVGAALRDERRRQGRTLAQVAEAAGISMQHLSDVERGRKDPSSEMLAAITGALAVGVPELLLRVADEAIVADHPVRRPLVLDLTGTAAGGSSRRPTSGAPGAEVSATSPADRSPLTLLSAA